MTSSQATHLPLLLSSALLCAAASPPNVTVVPADGLADTPFVVHVTSLKPRARVRIEAKLDDEQPTPQSWTAVGEYRADKAGLVDSATMPALGGSYRGILAGGLACSGLPAPRVQLPGYLDRLSREPGRTFPLLGTRDSFTVNVNAFANGRPIGSATILRRYAAIGVKSTEIAEGRTNGIYFEPARTTALPVVVLGGSGGGVPREQAALLASRGHPTLALAYFNYRDLKPSLVEIPLETFGDGAEWLSRRTGVARVALIGTSRGSEAVQLTAAHFPEHVAGIVAYVPSPLVHAGFGPGVHPWDPAWTLDGRGVPFVRFQPANSESAAKAREIEGKAPPGYAGAAGFLAEWTQSTPYLFYATPLERIDVPMLLLGGEADTVWPSGFGATKIKERMTALGKGRLVELHNYPEAGHGLSRVGLANAMSGFSIHPVSRQWSSTGGDAEANCAAGYDAWARVLAFLKRLPER